MQTQDFPIQAPIYIQYTILVLSDWQDIAPTKAQWLQHVYTTRRKFKNLSEW